MYAPTVIPLCSILITICYQQAPWSPRVGAGLVAHDFWNRTAGENATSSRSRIVLAGGYGGWLQDDEVNTYDGFYTRSDTWETYDGIIWRELNHNCSFGGRAWFGMANLADPNRTNAAALGGPLNVDNTQRPKKIYIFGGGYIGECY